MLAQVSQQLAEKGIKLEVTDAAKDFLGEKGYDEVFGARPLRRVIQDLVEDKLSEAVLRSEFKVYDRIFEIEAEVINVASTVINAEMPEITPAVIEAIKAMDGVLGVERSGNLLTVSCSEDLRADIEEAIKSNVEEMVKDNKAPLVKIKRRSSFTNVVEAVKAMEGVISVKSSGDLLTVYCSEDLKSQIEETIKDNGGLVVHIKGQSYVSKALVDVADNEIILRTDEKPLPGMAAVEALLGDDKP
jgi:hypothetical protein